MHCTGVGFEPKPPEMNPTQLAPQNTRPAETDQLSCLQGGRGSSLNNDGETGVRLRCSCKYFCGEKLLQCLTRTRWCCAEWAPKLPSGSVCFFCFHGDRFNTAQCLMTSFSWRDGCGAWEQSFYCAREREREYCLEEMPAEWQHLLTCCLSQCVTHMCKPRPLASARLLSFHGGLSTNITIPGTSQRLL